MSWPTRLSQRLRQALRGATSADDAGASMKPAVLRVSVVTVCLNARDTIRMTLESVRRQRDIAVEHIIVDGASIDDTCAIASEYQPARLISEKDNGVYDAMEKGAKAATGDIVIFLNAGDTFYDESCCADVAAYFDLTGADIVFGNLMPAYLDVGDSHDHPSFVPGKLLDLSYVVNRRQLHDESIHHQATFYRRSVFAHSSFISDEPAATGEYHLLLDAVMRNGAIVKHIPRPVSRFLLGGISTRDFPREWARYVKARDLLRARYFPNGAGVALSDDKEFRYADLVDAPTAANAAHRKHALKLKLKDSFAFRLYERLMRSQSGWVTNQISPHLDRLRHDVASDVTRLLGKSLKEITEKGLRTSQTQDKATVSNEQIAQALARQLEASVQIQQRLDALEALLRNAPTLSDRPASASPDADRANDGIRDANLRLDKLAAGLQDRLADLSGQLIQVQRSLKAEQGFSQSGFRVHSQWDEDGLIQFLIQRLPLTAKTFIEFGVGDYTESNTRFLLTHDNWRGLIFDSGDEPIEAIRNSPLYWRHDLTAVSTFVNAENINQLFLDGRMSGEIGLLSIDVDGVDYWLWQAVTSVSPCIVVCEYNGLFGPKAAITVPYDPQFDRATQHYSYLYAGASLTALQLLGKRKGYTLVGTNVGGNNAFFVRDDLLATAAISPEVSVYTQPKFREARTKDGQLSYLQFDAAQALIAHLPVVDVRHGVTKTIGEALVDS